MPVTQVNEQTFERDVLRATLPVLVEFGAEWCGPCKMVAPELDALAAELSGKASIVSVDIDKCPTLARELRIQSVPTFVVFAEGRPVGGKVGALRKKELRSLLDPFLPRAAGAIPPDQVAELSRAGRVSLVDLREHEVWQRSRIEGSANIPLAEIETRLAELHMLPNPPVMYCRAGDRSAELAAKLAGEGMPVNYLEGGVLAWEGAGYSLVRPD